MGGELRGGHGKSEYAVQLAGAVVTVADALPLRFWWWEFPVPVDSVHGRLSLGPPGRTSGNCTHDELVLNHARVPRPK